MKRDEWEFEYTAGTLAVAAHNRAAARRNKVKWWTEKKETVMAAIKESGISVHEDIAVAYGSTFNWKGGGGAQVQIDPNLQRELSECLERIKHHTEAAIGYEGWESVLEANREQRLRLDHADWLYFFSEA